VEVYISDLRCSILVLQEKIPIEEVFGQLKCTREGLSADEGENRLQIFGPNKLEEKKVRFLYICNMFLAHIAIWLMHVSST
jgi:H+-transporting ATPase